MRYLVFVFALVAAVGCKKDPPVKAPVEEPAPPLEDGPPAEMVDAQERQTQLLEVFADAVAAVPPGDCDAMASEMTRVIGEREDDLHAMDGYTEEQVMEHRDALEAKFGARIDAALGKLQPAIEPCAQDETVVDILEQLGLA